MSRAELLQFAKRVDPGATVRSSYVGGYSIVDVTVKATTYRLRSAVLFKEQVCQAALLGLQIANQKLVPRRTVQLMHGGLPMWLEDYVAAHPAAT